MEGTIYYNVSPKSGSDSGSDHGPFDFLGIDIFGAILAGLIFFLVAAWYAAAQDYFNHVRGLPSTFDTTFLFAFLWSLFVAIVLILAVVITAINDGRRVRRARAIYHAGVSEDDPNLGFNAENL